MNEAGSVEAIQRAREMVGEHTRLITCLAVWNGMDASTTVPEAIEAGVGLYGFTTPLTREGIVPLEPIFSQQVTELSDDKKNIAVLARAYRGKSEQALWQEGKFIEPDNPSPFRLTFQRRGRGWQDTARVQLDQGVAEITVKTPYGRGSGHLTKLGENWPKSIEIQLEKKPGVVPKETTLFGLTAGTVGVIVPLDGSAPAVVGEIDPKARIDRRAHIRFALKSETKEIQVSADKNDERIRVTLPAKLLQANPNAIAFQWGQAAK